MLRYVFIIVPILISSLAMGQSSYVDSIEKYQQQYIRNHEVVKGADKKKMSFYPVSKTYQVTTRLEKIEEAPWFNMETSGNQKKLHRVWGILHFYIRDTLVKLHIYQSKELMATERYADLLFIPFTDLTSGAGSYENGRYIDCTIGELESGNWLLDFNKAYNPYCAYTSSALYNCPVPPGENNMPVAILAGEKSFHE